MQKQKISEYMSMEKGEMLIYSPPVGPDLARLLKMRWLIMNNLRLKILATCVKWIGIKENISG